jgi:hypothetical protein
MKINADFRPLPEPITRNDCEAYLSAVLDEMTTVSGGLGWTWCQMMEHFPLEELKAAHKGHHKVGV